jgi:hypothetical protein
VFDNNVQRRISGLERDEVTGGWRKLHNEELHVIYSWLSIIRIIKSKRMRWAEQVEQKWDKRKVYKLLVGKPEGEHTTRKTRT